ncbi:MAG: hypothetical protein ABJP90_12630 [Paracoccaceae bacterium]
MSLIWAVFRPMTDLRARSERPTFPNLALKTVISWDFIKWQTWALKQSLGEDQYYVRVIAYAISRCP